MAHWALRRDAWGLQGLPAQTSQLLWQRGDASSVLLDPPPQLVLRPRRADPVLADQTDPDTDRSEPTSDNARARGALALLVLLLALATLVVNMYAPPGTVRTALTLLAALVVPGAAVATRISVANRLQTLALIIGLSLVIEVGLSLAMVWTRWWHPAFAASAVGALAAITLTTEFSRCWARAHRIARAVSTTQMAPPVLHKRLTWQRASVTAAALIPLLTAVALWALALPQIHPASFGASGLAGHAPPIFFLALAAALGGAVVLIWQRETNVWLLAAYITGVAVILYATIPAVAAAPQYAWTYKHIGVIRFIEGTGGVRPSVDIYNRWPGFFALAAAFSRVTGADPLSYAAWFEFVFTWLDALLVAAIAFAVTGNRKVAAMSTLTWLVVNWVGQDYLSPQALAFLLSLALMLVVVQTFELNGRLHSWLGHAVGAIAHRKDQVPAGWGGATGSRRGPILMVLALQAAIVASHQLTPYIVVLELGVLTLLGLRPRWLVLSCAALAVAYLIPNLSFIQKHYLLLEADPLANAQTQPLTLHLNWFFANVGGILSYASVLLAALGGLRLVRSGLAHRVVPIGVLSLAPFALLLATNYGGEALIRAFLFASPWLAILIAWGLSTLPRPWRLGVSLSAAGLLAVLALFAYAGNSGWNVIPRSEVTASNYFYAHAPRGSVLFMAGVDFPMRIGSRYAAMAVPTGGDAAPDLILVPGFRGRRFERRDLPVIAQAILTRSPDGYLVFSTSQDTFAKSFATVPTGTLEHLRQLVGASSLFRLWYSTADAQIYRVAVSRVAPARCATKPNAYLNPCSR